MDSSLIQYMDTMYYDNPTDIEHLGYTEEDIHDKELQQLLNDIYQLFERQDMRFEGDHLLPEPDNDDQNNPSQNQTTKLTAQYQQYIPMKPPMT
ncbi:hypothetical protein NDA12_000418 [Ustilago hordei]|nr:hypothetical protein NDA15_007263 [Ustilago hordei]KAJ1575627.1 hypothetical protein NDA12_000418 [Ustilago hordei]